MIFFFFSSRRRHTISDRDWSSDVCSSDLHIGGQVIRTTAQHPFFVQGRGWLEAGDLKIGDLLLSHDGQWLPVEDLFDTGQYETVYNLAIADYHTYFVGSYTWGFSVWAHNDGPCSATLGRNLEKADFRRW